ncbi:MAG: hypothetical protein U5N55_04380 [Cypionkella sp.]|nr:hypothetical protein [Cypionkella sp.]
MSQAYAAQIAALLGAHIIKISWRTDHLMLPEAKKVYGNEAIAIDTQAQGGGGGARATRRRARVARY